VYWARPKYLLDRRADRYFRGKGHLLRLPLTPGQTVGELTLLHLLEPTCAATEAAIREEEARLQAVPFDWKHDEVLDLFSRAYWPIIHNYLFVKVHFRRAPLADLTQETWLLFLKHLDGYDPRSGSPLRMMRFWASIVASRYLTRLRRPLETALTFSELSRQFADFGQVPEVEGILGLAGTDALHELLELPELAPIRLRLLELVFLPKQPPYRPLGMVMTKALRIPPHEILVQFGRQPLNELACSVETEYARASDLPAEEVHRAFRPVFERLALRFEQAVTHIKDPTKYVRVAGRVLGEVTIMELLGPAERPTNEKTEELSSWSREAFERFVEAAKKDARLRELLAELLPEVLRRRAKGGRQAAGKTGDASPVPA
jgi:hypothetical protein